jgi:hypothetical protein
VVSDEGVEAATRRDLERFEQRKPGISQTALAASALKLAERIDNPRTAATAFAMIAREHRDHMEQLRGLLPPEQAKDKVSDLAAAREARRARAAGGAGA